MEVVKAINDELDDKNEDDKVLEAFSMADEDNLMMMNCVALLAALQKEEQQRDIPASIADSRVVRNKVFMAALSVVGNSLLKIESKEPTTRTNAAIDQLMDAFPVPEDTYLAETKRKGWLPLHWAMVLLPLEQHDVTEVDVTTLSALYPIAMATKHVEGGRRTTGLIPAQLLCMHPTRPHMLQLVCSLWLCSPYELPDATMPA